MLQARAHHDSQDGQDQEQVVIEVNAIDCHAHDSERLAQRHASHFDRADHVDPLRPVGDVDRSVQVVEEDPDDFTKAQRHDGEIVAPQLEHRCPQHDAENGSQECADRQDHPPRPENVEVRGVEQRIGVAPTA